MFLDPEALTGKIMGGYQLKRIIGAGGAGTVYVGENAAGEQVAVKVLLPAIRVSAEEMAAIRQRFQREAEVLARLRHPHILPLLAFDTDPVTGHFFMVMPLLPGGTLADRLNHGPLSFEQVSAYITQIASALDYAHEQNVIHRDIKPSNVLLDENDQAVLADFGIAKMVDSIGMTLTATGAILGTPEYMSLEQLQGNNDAITAATDVYGLGALAYHLLTDQKPFDGKTPQAVILAVAQTTPISPRTLRPDLPQPAEAVILKALARRPEQRYATTGAFAAALDLGLRGIWPPREERPSAQPSTVAASVPFTVTPPEKAPAVPQGPFPLPGGAYGPPAYPPMGYGAPASGAPAGYPPAGWVAAPPMAPPVVPPRRRMAPWIIGVAGVVVALLAVLLRGVFTSKGSVSSTGQHSTSATRTSATGTPSTGTSSYFTYTYKPPTKTGGTVAIGFRGSIDSLNPATASGTNDFEFSSALWGSCAVQLPDLTLGSKGWVPDQCTQVPTLANSGESSDGMTTTLHIDPQAVWSDGQPITASDYLLTYQIDKNVLGDFAPISLMKSVTAVDTHTVQISWQSPYAPYLTALWAPEPEHIFGAFSTGTYTNAFLSGQAFNTAFTVDSGA